MCRSVKAGQHKFVFIVRGPIILVAVCSGPDSQAQVCQSVGLIHSIIVRIILLIVKIKWTIFIRSLSCVQINMMAMKLRKKCCEIYASLCSCLDFKWYLMLFVVEFLYISSQLVVQLTYVYHQVLSVLTFTQLTKIFEHRRNYDLRKLLAGQWSSTVVRKSNVLQNLKCINDNFWLFP